MELVSLFKRVIGLGVHQRQVIACAIIEQLHGQLIVEQRRFGAFNKDRGALAEWCAAFRPEEVVMESTGIYWKSPYTALEAVGIRAKVVNARHVKHVPGRKTDIGDAQSLAMLARAGLLRASFVPKAKLRELRLYRPAAPEARGLGGLGEEPAAQGPHRWWHPSGSGGERINQFSEDEAMAVGEIPLQGIEPLLAARLQPAAGQGEDLVGSSPLDEGFHHGAGRLALARGWGGGFPGELRERCRSR
jgi:hypothetical protein